MAELSDDHTRFANPRALKAYAGSAPITRSSGRKTTVLARHIKNRRLASADYTALTASPGARAHYDCRRQTEDRHIAAPRNLIGRWQASVVMLVPDETDHLSGTPPEPTGPYPHPDC
ncbi:transposase [Streptomyces sp. NPDC051452]|uniref:transposase n=1 Tax=Streptomyces sp. NPDC051452 TaxID=3365654 RepID=UPI00379DBB3F